MNVKTKKNLILGVLIVLASLLCGGVSILCSNPTTAYAASNTNIYSFCGNESTTHNLTSNTSGLSSYSENLYLDTAIKIHGVTNSGVNSVSNYIQSDCSTICIDFANARSLYIPDMPDDGFGGYSYYDKTYAFQILSGSSVKWQATYTGSTYSQVTGKDENGNDVKTTYYQKVININGKSTTTSSTSSSMRHFSPRDFGTNFVSLSDGTYTIKIIRTYHWQYWKSIFAIPKYDSSSTMTGTLVIDTTSPTLTMRGYSSGNTISNGAYSSERATFTATDSNFYRLCYKTPTSSGYSYTSSRTYTSGTANGWYYVYAEDNMGHRSQEYSFYYDSTVPTGKIYSNGTVVNSGAYIGKAFSYSATDNGSGVGTIYYKTPVSGVYQQYSSGMVIQTNSGDGWYYFYSVDNVGNRSATMSVYLETRDPLVHIYRNDELAYSKTVTGSGSFDTDIYLNQDDKLRISCDTSSGKVSSNYALDTNITIGSSYTGSHYTITLTSATGITSNFTYHIVRNKPTISIDGNTYLSGSTLHFNSDKTVAFNDDSVITNSADTGASISSEGNVNLNEHVTYSSGSGKTLTTASGTETKYILTLGDRAGNESQFTVFIDKLAPTGVWKTDGKVLENNGYTNKPLSFNMTEAGVTATYSHDGGEYVAYTSGKTLTEDGTYHVVLTDLAGNKSVFTAYIDTVAPMGQLYANNVPVANGTITNKSVFFSWDGEITATVNGRPYIKNSMLTDDSLYKFVLTDFAGNFTEYKITVDTVAPSHNSDKLEQSQRLITKWYLATVDGRSYSFATYEEALAFACNHEFEQCVTVLTLNNLEDFTQHHLVADGSKVREGEYWLYKSKANPDSLLYYFDKAVLDNVVAFYAKNDVSVVNYYNPESENNYGVPSVSMSDNKFNAPDGKIVPVLNGFVFDEADGSELYAELVGGDGLRIKLEYGVPFDEQITTGGVYKIIEIDEAGNAAEFFGFMDVLAPELSVSATIIGETDPTELIISKDRLVSGSAFYYESFNVNAIKDADKWAVLAVEKDGETDFYTYGDVLPCLNIGGEYLVSVYDRLDNGYSFTVYIIGSPANIAIENNADDTAFSLTISLEQKFDTLVSLEIRRNGELLEDVSTETMSYVFDKAGKYTVSLRDNFGRVIVKEYVFNKSLPNGIFEGVTDGGKTKSDVSFIFDGSRYFAVVTKDGAFYAEDRSGELRIKATDYNSGYYTLRLTRIDDPENFTDYSFTINTFSPDFDISVADTTTTNKNVTVTWSDTDIVSVVYSLDDEEVAELKNGDALSVEGTYTVVATNDLGTQSRKTFTIDKTLEYDVLINNAETAGIDTTNQNVTVINREPLLVDVTRNGMSFDFGFGQVLAEEGYYGFRIYDEYGNTAVFTIVIDKTVDIQATVGNGIISNGDVIISAGEKVNAILTKDGEEFPYTLGTKITEEGAYRMTAYDMNGNEKILSFRIVKGTKKKLDYELGDNVLVKSVMREGEAVETDGARLNFTTDGMYTVVCESEGHEYTFTLELDTTAPTIDLKGVKNGGVSGKPVTIENLSEEGILKVYRNGELVGYELGEKLSEYGAYRIVVTDSVGNTNEYNFTLKYQMDGGIIALIVIGVLAVAGACSFFIFKKVRKH